MSAPTVGLVGSRAIDQGLQASKKETFTEFVFTEKGRPAQTIGCCPEGSVTYKGPKTGDCYADGVEDTNL